MQDKEHTSGVTDAQARTFLVDRFGGDVADLARAGHGEWSRAYVFRCAEGGRVVRFSALREDFDKDRLAARYATPDLPIPRVLEIGVALGGYYCVTERAPGGYVDTLDEAGMRAVLPALFAALDAARLADISATTGYGSWGADGAAPHPTWLAALLDVAEDRPTDRVNGWRHRLAGSPVGDAAFEEALALLRSLADYAPPTRHLIHSDLLHFNVLVAGDRLTAVLDWGCSLYGDFLYDVAWLTFWSPWYPAWQRIDFAAEAARHYADLGLDVPHFAERLRCCELHIGLGGLSWCAFRGNWTELEWVAQRTLAVARGALTR